MKQEIQVHNYVDKDGNPAGGTVHGTGLMIVWQDGPLQRGEGRREPNGAFVEGVIGAALQRLQFYQEGVTPGGQGKFACRENEMAITKLEEALFWLYSRTADRERRGVEGTHVV